MARTAPTPASARSAPTRLPPHPESPHARYWRRWVLEQRKPLAVDLFSGCGGLSLGLHDAGYAVVLAADNDEWALETYRHNLPGIALEADLADPDRRASIIRLLEGIPIDLIAGGPPCQPFSRAGRAKIRSLVEQGVRSEEDERRQLWRPFLEIVAATRPRAVLIENVPDMALSDDLVLVRTIAAELDRLGYLVDFRILEASRHGVPQFRQRLFVVGTPRNQPIEWPDPERPVTVRQAIGDLPKLNGTTGSIEMAAGTPRTEFQRRARRRMNGSRVVFDHVTRPVRADDREAFQLLRPGMRYSDLPARLRRYRSDIFDDKYHRLDWNKVSRSITAHIAKDGYWYIHPEEPRTLSVREAARLQTFPDHFRFAGTRSHAFRQIGNAVPPLLAEKLAKALLTQRNSGARRRSATATPDWHRTRLEQWANRDRRTAAWRYPDDPWRFLVAQVLSGPHPPDPGLLRRTLQAAPRPTPGAAAEVQKLARDQGGAAARRLVRVAACARALARRGWNHSAWVAAASLPAGRSRFVLAVLARAPVLPVTAPMARVAGRIHGRSTARGGSTVESRLHVARIAGTGPRTPLILAALEALGQELCLPRSPHCRRCPLRTGCLHGRAVRKETR